VEGYYERKAIPKKNCSEWRKIVPLCTHLQGFWDFQASLNLPLSQLKTMEQPQRKNNINIQSTTISFKFNRATKRNINFQFVGISRHKFLHRFVPEILKPMLIRKLADLIPFYFDDSSLVPWTPWHPRAGHLPGNLKFTPSV